MKEPQPGSLCPRTRDVFDRFLTTLNASGRDKPRQVGGPVVVCVFSDAVFDGRPVRCNSVALTLRGPVDGHADGKFSTSRLPSAGVPHAEELQILRQKYWTGTTRSTIWRLYSLHHKKRPCAKITNHSWPRTRSITQLEPYGFWNNVPNVQISFDTPTFSCAVVNQLEQKVTM